LLHVVGVVPDQRAGRIDLSQQLVEVAPFDGLEKASYDVTSDVSVGHSSVLAAQRWAALRVISIT
jgi:hypothetical protein